MGVRIHPTAVVDPAARLGDGVTVGAYTVIEAGVAIGADCEIGPFCRFASGASVGDRNRFESHCSIGAPPQDLKFAGEATRLEIGNDNWVREFVTLHRGTPGGGGLTRIGDKNLFMAYAHVAHDCRVGSHTIFANSGTLAGHVEVGDFATIGALSAVHQFTRVGQHAFLGGFTGANKDCLPFMSTVGNRPAKCYGPNVIGLERKGFSEDRRAALKQAWRLLHNPRLNTTQALAAIREELGGQPDVASLLDFIAGSKRGVILG
ncbi:MAG: acyl-ACP--UDP-N-acetylglucosamine O-acyltransferase [Thermoanaerobaculales bacterium]|jgi:UDP-N-acetylglucosamine acyltransferase|nr:acyl-ACP--UDP-N-acetylglucosamine O-acyltransferase [Thermoanaerobaculales bacterium]